MRLTFTIYCNLVLCTIISAQVANWENYTIPADAFIKDAGSNQGFTSGAIYIPNIYIDDPAFPYWVGWILSNGTVDTFGTLINEHTAMGGSGALSTANYAIAYAGFSGAKIYKDNASHEFVNMQVNNNAFAYYSMKNGDNIAKKFGGTTGNDEDFLLLTIKGYQDGELTEDSIEFYLADYRFADNSLDYIVEDWVEIDLSLLAMTDSLLLSISGSDIGAFGLNTPAYVAVDEIRTQPFLSTDDNDVFDSWYYDQGNQSIIINMDGEFELQVFDYLGRLVQNVQYVDHQQELKLASSGIYFVRLIRDSRIIDTKTVYFFR